MASSKQGGSKAGVGCLLLFSLPFAAVGVVMLVLISRTLLEYGAMRNWRQVPAKIVGTKLEAHHDDDSTTYEVTAKYTYVYNGRNHTGTRVGLDGGSDNIGSFHREAHQELKRYQQSGEPFRCFVNPEEPSESILYRQPRWEMLGFYTLFALVFGGVGFGLLIGSSYAYRKVRAEQASAAEHPDEPWLWRDQWAKGEITSSNKKLLRFVWIFAVFWNLVSSPLLFILPGELMEKGNRLALLGLLFPAVGLGLLLWGVYLLLQWWKYGESVFQMAAVPGVIGGKLAGVIRTVVNIEPRDGYQLTLNCIHKYTSGSSKNQTTREDILWQDQRLMARELLEDDFSRTAIPVLFGIPYDCRPSDEWDSRSKITWRLEVAAKLRGIDYKASFDVPVFKTSESRSDFELDESLIADYAAPSDADLQLKAAGVDKTVAPSGGTRYIFPMARHPGPAIGLTVFAAIWNGAIALMLYFDLFILFPILFGLLDLFILYGLLDVWFYQSAVDVFHHRLSVTGGLFGAGRTHQLDAAAIRSVRPRRGMQAGNTLYWSIAIRLQSGPQIIAAKRLPSRRHAEAVIADMKSELDK